MAKKKPRRQAGQLAAKGTRVDAEKREMYERYLRGSTHHAIGLEMGYSRQYVQRACQQLNEEAIEAHADFVAEIKLLHTSRLELVFKEAFEAWQRSKEDAVQVKEILVSDAEDNGPGVEKERTRRGQSGDSKHLASATKALDDIRAIWGANAPSKSESKVGGTVTLAADEELRADLQDIHRGLGLILGAKNNGEGS